MRARIIRLGGTPGAARQKEQPWSEAWHGATFDEGTTYLEPVGDLDSARAFALSLPGSTEEPHFDMSSFRVRGRIFATVPPDDEHLHVFVDEGEVHAAVAEDPAAFEPLLWGQRLRGLRIRIAAAPDHRVAELLEESWRRRAPARLAAEWDAQRDRRG
jgi:hypothetical protein